MADCPPNAINRGPDGEVYINDTCIGCGNCQRNCPYGVIRMDSVPPKKPGLLSWLLFGRGLRLLLLEARLRDSAQVGQVAGPAARELGPGFLVRN